MYPHLQRSRKAFGDANGWVYRTTMFNLGQLVRGSPRKTKDEYWHPHSSWHRGFDHSEYYWLGRKPIAIVTHPYPGANEGLWEVAQRWPFLKVRECPDRQASWYYPGRTLLFVVTRRGEPVVWPTSDEVQLAIREHLEYEEMVRVQNEANKARAIRIRAKLKAER